MLTLLFTVLSVLVIVLIARLGITRNSLQVEIIRLNLQLASVTASRDAMTKAYEGMREIARKSIEALSPSVSPRFAFGDVLPDSDPYDVKYCERCNVSVRGTVWPIDCPACGAVIGDVLDADEIG